MLQGVVGCDGLLQLCHTAGDAELRCGIHGHSICLPVAQGLSVSRGSHGVCTSLWSLVLWGARDLEQGAAVGQS